jgi:hypothetical protein
MILGLLFVVLQINAVMVANSWSDQQTWGDRALSSGSAGIVGIQPRLADRNAVN